MSETQRDGTAGDPSHRYAMIMAGGAGTRLWPMSRKDRPKQLLPLVGGAHAGVSANSDAGGPGAADRRVSLLALAASRLEGLIEPARRFICTGERYRGLIESELPDFSAQQVLGEPEGRDTANAVGFAAAVLERRDPDAVFAVLTADHVIEPNDRFQAALRAGFEIAEAEPTRFVTFGITPTYPATGFGYVERGGALAGEPGVNGSSFDVRAFVEKPDLARATAYVHSGDYLWNSGMFVFHAGGFMRALDAFLPESAAGLREIAGAWDTPDQQAVLERVYPTLPKISVDYGVMEPASGVEGPAGEFSIAGVEMDVRWLDVGSWPSFAETLTADEQGNRTLGEVTLQGCTNSLAVAQPGHRLALLGCEGVVVVQTADATLVMPADQAQDLKALHAKLPEHLK